MRTLSPTGSYRALYEGFRWRIPERFNIGAACTRQPPEKTALVAVGENGGVRRLTFGTVDRRANQLANVLSGLGLVRSDRVGPAGRRTSASRRIAEPATCSATQTSAGAGRRSTASCGGVSISAKKHRAGTDIFYWLMDEILNV